MKRAFPQLMKMNEVVEITGLSRATIYRMIADKSFPNPIHLSKGRIAFTADALSKWFEEKGIPTASA